MVLISYCFSFLIASHFLLLLISYCFLFLITSHSSSLPISYWFSFHNVSKFLLPLASFGFSRSYCLLRSMFHLGDDSKKAFWFIFKYLFEQWDIGWVEVLIILHYWSYWNIDHLQVVLKYGFLWGLFEVRLCLRYYLVWDTTWFEILLCLRNYFVWGTTLSEIRLCLRYDFVWGDGVGWIGASTDIG